MSISFRRFIALPPFISESFLNDGASNPRDLGMLTLAAMAAAKEKHKDEVFVNDIEKA